MRLEVRYPSGSQHEVELSGSVAVLGRDPSCDLVLNDAKCSRRHAVLEAGPDGLAIRDAGSANGIFVNGQKVERAQLKDGDTVRLGEVTIKVLPEDMPGTLVMAAEDMEAFEHKTPAPPPPPPPPVAAAAPPPPPPPPPPPRAASAPRVAAPPRPEPPAHSAPMPADSRPLTVTVLAVLWFFGILLYPISGLSLASATGWSGLGWLYLAAAAFMALISGVLGFGLWTRASWARSVQIAFAGLGLLTCAYTPASGLILWYMLRGETAEAFSGRRRTSAGGSQEPLFAIGIVACLILSLFLGGIVAAIAIPSLLRAKAVASRPAAEVVGRMRSVAAAQQAFSSGTCGAYADLEGLMRPASVIPNYPASGPSFLDAKFQAAEEAGYRFELTVEELVDPSDGCPARAFRRFAYVATPLVNSGRHMLVTEDGVVRGAQGRPAAPSDPPVE